MCFINGEKKLREFIITLPLWHRERERETPKTCHPTCILQSQKRWRQFVFILTLQGNMSVVQNALDKIFEKVLEERNRGARVPPSEQLFMEVVVPNSAAGMIIGHGGETVQKIQTECHCKVTVSKVCCCLPYLCPFSLLRFVCKHRPSQSECISNVLFRKTDFFVVCPFSWCVTRKAFVLPSYYFLLSIRPATTSTHKRDESASLQTQRQRK